MAKKIKAPRKLGKPTIKGYRKQIGFVRDLDGTIKSARFWLGTDEPKAWEKYDRLELEWKKLRAAGYTWWTDEVLTALQTEGVVDFKSGIRGDHASRLIGEPYNDTEIAAFKEPETGLIKPEVAPQLLDFGSRKLFTRLDVRSRFFEDLYKLAMKDPIAAFERCSRIFGWSAEKTQQFLFNINSGTVSAIAFDASEKSDAVVDGSIIDDSSNSDS